MILVGQGPGLLWGFLISEVKRAVGYLNIWCYIATSRGLGRESVNAPACATCCHCHDSTTAFCSFPLRAKAVKQCLEALLAP